MVPVFSAARRNHYNFWHGREYIADACHRPDDLGRRFPAGPVGELGVLDPPRRCGQAAGAQPPAAGGAAFGDPVHPRGAHLPAAAAAPHAGRGVLADAGGGGAAAGDRGEREEAWVALTPAASLRTPLPRGECSSESQFEVYENHRRGETDMVILIKVA